MGGLEEKGREEEIVVVEQGGRDVEDQSWKGLEMNAQRDKWQRFLSTAGRVP